MDSRAKRVEQRAEDRRSRRRTWRRLPPLELPGDVYERLTRVAREHGVSVRTYMRAMVLENTGVRPQLTTEPADVINKITRRRFST